MSPLLVPVAEAEDGEALPATAWAKRHGSDFTGKRIPFGCGVYFKPAATKYHIDEANARAQFCISWDIDLLQVVAGTANTSSRISRIFVNLDLAEDANAQGIAIREHVTTVVYLPKEGYVFPMLRYDNFSSHLVWLRHRFVEPDELPELVVGVDPDEESGIPSASFDGIDGEWSSIHASDARRCRAIEWSAFRGR